MRDLANATCLIQLADLSASTLFYRYRDTERLSELAMKTPVKGRHKPNRWHLNLCSHPLSTQPNTACCGWLRCIFTLEIWASQRY